MSLDFDAFAILLLLAPFFAALLAPLIARETGRAAGWILAIVPAGLFLALLSLIDTVAQGTPVRLAIDWVPALGLRFGLTIDGLALVFGLLITGIGTVIIVYAGEYLASHPRRGRLLAVLLLFMGAMLGLVLTDSLVALFAFWELTALTSFLLIGFDRERPAARRAALQALVVTGTGGLALMAGGILLYVASGRWDISGLMAFGGSLRVGPAYPWVLGFMLVAAFTKSAQVPFHFWLPGAMEAPVPVSAYLHSATMVQVGVYLLARFSPMLSGTPLWQGLLCSFGGVTLLWGATLALRQTDLKQLLAQSTVAVLGLLVVLLGIGGATMAMAVAAMLVAHALYKAALFLVAGIVDKQTGTRDLTRLGGLRDHLTISFIAAGVAALSMLGLPPFLGWFAKEEIYRGLSAGDPWSIAVMVVLVLGNALLGAAALALAIRPFMGPLRPTPVAPQEGPFPLWIGPIVFGLLSLAVVFAVGSYGDFILAPVGTAIAGTAVVSDLSFALDPAGPAVWLTLATWALAGLVYWWLDIIRANLALLGDRLRWTFAGGFDRLLFGLIRFGAALARTVQHGRLELYAVVAFGALALVLIVPLWQLRAWPDLPNLAGGTPYEWAAALLAVAGIGFVLGARSRLLAIVALGIQGLALALLFLFFGAPDLALTQLMIEVLSVVIIALAMTRLQLSARDPRPWEDWLRDGSLAVACGAGLTLLLLRVLQVPLDSRLGDFFARMSASAAHGHNIVNVILVDFRGLDTLGEITVVMTAAIGALALLRRQHKRTPTAPKRPRRKAAA